MKKNARKNQIEELMEEGLELDNELDREDENTDENGDIEGNIEGDDDWVNENEEDDDDWDDEDDEQDDDGWGDEGDEEDEEDDDGWDDEGDEEDEEDDDGWEDEDDKEDDDGNDDYDEDKDDDLEDLFILGNSKRRAILDEGNYIAKIGKITAESQATGLYGPWTKITVPFKINNPKDDKVITVNFVASSHLSPTSKLFILLEEVLGKSPSGQIDIREIEGKKVKVNIEHNLDKLGNEWEAIAEVRRIKKKNR
ncbi:hypothetical protein SAMN05660297_02630 [Natronincola peptidivorans]|uniref:Uncharacterized protein n=1 Tax=Natronincola peptidivorans TaxID=426128 RepID=A0A1I0F1W9_9FIRM|nr:hypothetical protein [Natronincola peptidivorans]SET51616.1 hypothetical protein SAMN05660297_02630 [Natronincola peptidivorans]